MATLSELGVRLALAYLLLTSGIDTLTHDLPINGINASDTLLHIIALLSISGGLILAIGWRLPLTALILAGVVLISISIKSSLLAAIMAIGLLLLAYRSARRTAQHIAHAATTTAALKKSRCHAQHNCCA